MTDRARTAGVFGGRFTSRSRATVKGCVRNGPDAGAGPSFLRDAWGPGPSPRDLLAIFAAAVVLRALLALLSFASFDLCHPACPMRDAGKSLLHLAHDYALRADGKSYMAYARAIHGDAVWIEARDGPGVGAAGLSPEAMARDTGKFEAYDRRVFPGFPMLLAAVALTGIPLPLAALAIPWLCAGLAASLTAKLAGDRRLGWGMALLTPHYLLYSSLAMTESILLAAAVGGLVLLMSGAARPASAGAATGGVLLGLAGLIRPNAVFALAGALAWCGWRRRWRAAVLLLAGAAVAALAGLLLVRWRVGDPLAGLAVYQDDPRAFGGRLFSWPFRSLLVTTAGLPPARLWKAAYIWLHVVVVLWACVVAVRNARRAWRGPATLSSSMDVLAAPWIVGNTAFILCIGSSWGFQAFHRYAVWALPAILWPLRGALPHRARFWIPLGLLSLVIAWASVMRN